MEINKFPPIIPIYSPAPPTVSAQQEKAPEVQGDSVSLTSAKAPKKKSSKPSSEPAVKNEQPPPSNEPPKKKWTIMLYSAADNNLTSYMVDDVNELEGVGSDANTNLFVQLDQGGVNCKRYFLEKDSDPKTINSPMLADMGKTDMADPNVLADFIKFGVQNYPAQHYALIISDHGNGWKGAVEDAGTGSWMNMGTIKDGVAKAEADTGVKLDVLGYDACLMANTEVAYQLKDNANYMVASEQTEGADGWPYVKIFSGKAIRALQTALRQRIDLDPKDFAMKVVQSASGYPATNTMSAVDMAKMPELAKAADSFAEKILVTNTSKDTLKGIARKTLSFYGYKDLGDFCTRVVESKDVKDEGLKTAAKGVLDALSTAVIAEEHSSQYPGAHGLTIEIPTYGSTSSDYGQLDFAKDTKWKQAMDKLGS